MIILRVLFHLLPVIPFAMQKPSLGFAVLLLVALPYIKVLKFESLMQEKGATADDKETLRRSRDRWLNLTFLKR